MRHVRFWDFLKDQMETSRLKCLLVSLQMPERTYLATDSGMPRDLIIVQTTQLQFLEEMHRVKVILQNNIVKKCYNSVILVKDRV
jgi:hypothetical protein